MPFHTIVVAICLSLMALRFCLFVTFQHIFRSSVFFLFSFLCCFCLCFSFVLNNNIINIIFDNKKTERIIHIWKETEFQRNVIINISIVPIKWVFWYFFLRYIATQHIRHNHNTILCCLCALGVNVWKIIFIFIWEKNKTKSTYSEFSCYECFQIHHFFTYSISKIFLI